MNLPRWSLRNPVTVTMLIISILLLGGVSAARLPLAFLPEVDFPGVQVEIPYPNALPAQVEEEITRPAEEALATLSRVKRITSNSSSEAAFIYVQFDWGEDIEPLRLEAREKLERIRDQLPADVDKIVVNSFRSSDIPVLECRVSADRDLSRSYELLDRHVADRLRRVPGVAKVQLYGVEPPEVQIHFRMASLRRHGLEAREVVERLESSNRSMSAGHLMRGDEQWPTRVVNQFATLEEIESFPVNATGLRLADIATVELSEPELNYGRHLNHTRAIGLDVLKDSGANTVAVVRRCKAALAEMKLDPMLEGIEVLTFTDQAEQIENSLVGLLESGLVGALLATGVLFFFLRRLTATLVVATAIPVSLTAATGILYFTGGSLNILSMMGLMLSVGLVADNAVVVLESIERKRQKGMGRLRAALTGTHEVMPAVISATLASMIVFLPLVVGARTEISTWIGEVGRTIIFTLVCSLFLSLTAIPFFMGRILPGGQSPRIGAIEWLGGKYQRVLRWTLRHRVRTLAAGAFVFAASVAAFIPVDKTPFAGTKVEAVRVEYDFADNVNYQEAERYVSSVEGWILARQDSLHVKSTYSYFTNNFAMTRAYLEPTHANDEGAQEVRKQIRDGIPDMPGAVLRLGGDDDDSGSSRMVVRLFGDPGPRMEMLAEEVRRRIATVEGLSDAEVGGEKGREEIEVVVRADQAMHYGLTTSRVASDVALFFRGRPLARYRGPDGEVEVNARLAKEDRENIHQLREMPLRNAEGGIVPLAAVADFRTVDTPGEIQRQQRRTVMTVGGNMSSRKFEEIRKDVREVLNAMSFPAGYSWSFGFGFEEADETMQEMMINLVLALFLVFFVMAGLFESLIHPFAIMFALPFAFAGIAWMSLLTNSPFNLMSQIGLLILIGIVVNNGIVLIYHVHQLRGRGMERGEAILEAARDRLRPILMTTTTTILGLVPLAIGQAHVGDVLYFPLARTVIGGLAAATILTLVLVPTLYTVIEDGQSFVARVWRSGPRADASPVSAAAGGGIPQVVRRK